MGRSPLGAGFQSVLDEDDFFISSKLSWLDTESLVDENIGVENAFFAFGILGFVQILIAVFGLSEHCTIFHFPPSVRPSRT